MPQITFDLLDGQPPVSLTLSGKDAERFAGFVGECYADRANANALLARIAELEADIAALRAGSNLVAGFFTETREERDRLRAEVEALRADAVIEWEPGRRYTAAELLRRVIANAKPRKGDMLWPAVMKLCGVGSTVAHYLCRWAGRDPDTGKEIAARKGEGSEPPENCRQRLRAEGKAYPRSSCEACGQFSPKHAGCDALLEAKRAAQSKEGAE